MKFFFIILLFSFYSLFNACEIVYPQAQLLEAIKSQNDAGNSQIIKDHSINVCDDKGNTLLIALATNAQLAEDDKARLTSIQCLIKWGADINAQNNAGDTALLQAINNSSKLALELLDLGADVQPKNNKGKTASDIVQLQMNIEEPLPCYIFFNLQKIAKIIEERRLQKLL
ncbi:hypothetical protein BH09DEP1_BH09DEP1_7780 [soil metagenome]